MILKTTQKHREIITRRIYAAIKDPDGQSGDPDRALVSMLDLEGLSAKLNDYETRITPAERDWLRIQASREYRETESEKKKWSLSILLSDRLRCEAMNSDGESLLRGPYVAAYANGCRLDGLFHGNDRRGRVPEFKVIKDDPGGLGVAFRDLGTFKFTGGHWRYTNNRRRAAPPEDRGSLRDILDALVDRESRFDLK